MENDVLLDSHHGAANEEIATVRDELEIQVTAHHCARALEHSRSPPSSHRQLVGGTVCEYQQEIGSRTSTTPLLSPQERGNHLVSDSRSESTTGPHSALSLSGHFQPRSPSQAAALAGTGGEEAVVAISSEVVAQIKALLEINTISREQFMNIYDEYVNDREQQQQAQLSRFSMAQAQAQAAAMLNSTSMVAAAVASAASNNNNHTSTASIINSRQHVNMHTSDDATVNDEEDTSSQSPLLTAAHTHEDHLNSHRAGSHDIELVDITPGNREAAELSMETMDDADCTENNSKTPTGEGEEEEESAITIGGTPLMMDGEDEENGRGGVDVGVGVGGEGSQVGKMQTLVRTALESYETASPVMSEIGQKRKHFTLEEELRLQPSPFAQQLLERDQTLVAQAIKRYMNQYSIPQREVVEKTGLNQSHLSQHFLHGVTMKRAKRIKLYHWFEEDQKARTGKLQSADGSLNAVLESPKVEGSRRRPRWKWSPISTQILTEAFKKNQFPTREQRLELSRVCNDAELAMNNGAMIRGPEGDTEGITEQRINTWFTNRRKGLTTPITPSPTKALTPGGSNLTFAHAFHPLLRAGPATTPVLTPGVSIGAIRSSSSALSSNGTPPKFGSLTTTPLSLSSASGVSIGGGGGEEGKPSPVALIPNTVQTLVSQIQQAQVHHHHHQHHVGVSGAAAAGGGVTVASPLSQAAQVISTTPPSSHLQSSPHLALPLAIALPGGSASVLSSSSPHTLTTAPTPMQTVTVSPNVNPNAIHALLSQLHAPSAISAPLQLTAAAAAAVSNAANNSSGLAAVQPTNIITLPGPPPPPSVSSVHLHSINPPPPLTSANAQKSSPSATPSAFQAITVNTGGSSNGGDKNRDSATSAAAGTPGNVGSGGGKEHHHHRASPPTGTAVTTLSQAQLQALMSQVQGTKVIADGTSPLAQFQLLTLPAGISLATPTGGAGGGSGIGAMNSEPPVLWAAAATNTPQGVPQTS